MKFNGIDAPILQVSFAMNFTSGVPQSSVSDPSGTSFVLDTSHLDTGQLGTLQWTDLSADVDHVTFSSGQGSELDDPQSGQCVITLDNYSGNYDPSNGSSPYNGVFEVGIPVWVRAIWSGVTYNLWRGFVDDINCDLGRQPATTVTCLDALELMGRTSFTSGYPDADDTGTRIGRILDNAAWPSSQRNLDTGYSLCQATSDAAASALSQLSDTVATELGLLVQDGSGNIAFYNRLHPYLSSRSTSVQATFSDAGTDIDMLSVALDRTRQLVFNQTRITRNGGTEQVYDATSAGPLLGGATSQQQWGVRSYQGHAGTLLRSDPDALALGGFIVARFQYPTSRVTQVNVDAAPQGIWASVLGVQFLDRIRVIRNYGPNSIDKQMGVIGISQDITQDAWMCTFNTRNLDDFAPFILDNATYGKLASSPISGFGHLA